MARKDHMDKHVDVTADIPPPPSLPDLVGMSLLHAGQVIPAAALSMVVKELWPKNRVVWGGPHISGMGVNAIQQDLARRQWVTAADTFVTGHAEETFVALLDQHLSSQPSIINATNHQRVVHPGLIQGFRGRRSVIPMFENLDWYDDPPILLAQSTLGCAYGRCAFCTYPAMEPIPTKLDLCITVGSVVTAAERLNHAPRDHRGHHDGCRRKTAGPVSVSRTRW